MNATVAGTWVEANQRHICAAMNVVQARLESARRRLTDDADGGDGEIDHHRAAAAQLAVTMDPPAKLEHLARMFGLSPFEREVLVLVAAVELVAAVSKLCASLHGDPRHTQASFGLALWALADAHWTALSPEAPLRRWRLVELGSGGLTDARLRIDERILHELVGVPCLDERLRGFTSLAPAVQIPLGHTDTVDAIVRCLTTPSRPVVVVTYGSPDTRLALACAAAQRVGSTALLVHAADAPTAPTERAIIVTLLHREALLRGAAIILEHEAWDTSEGVAFTRALVDTGAPVLIATDGAVTLRRPTVHIRVPALDSAARHELWRAALGDTAATMPNTLEAMTREFNPDPTEIERLGSEWRCRVEAGERAPAAGEHPIRTRLRAENRRRFEGLAQVIVPAAEPGDLVLPATQAEFIRQIEVHLRHQQTVHHDWGFARRESRGLGITALFHGPSGTGKTLAAEVIARRLGFDLVRVDLSQVVSKYIGETEKNLRRVFDAAEHGGVVLLFDEADALFGKRSEVKDSHDRHANIEVGYLLQRMEAFRGLAVLTTNLKQSLDAAFLRRLRFVVAFPFPDLGERRRLWECAFPGNAPREGLDYDRLARLQVTGGNIRNIALHAAFLAAEERTPLRMPHLWRAARDECARIEKSVSAAEIGGWI